MAENIGDAILHLSTEGSGLERGMASAEAKAKNLEKVFSKTGKKLSLFLTTPILGIGAAFVKTAAQAEEVNSKFDTVFKDQAAGVREWARTFSDATGRANVDNLKFLASVQDLFVPLGITRDKAADLSKAVVTLATDVSSFNDLPTADVMRDIQSALVGNHETVRKYGVILDEVTVNQELLNMGIKGGYKEATAAEKAIARYNLIVAGTADAQGDAVRTAGSFTNQFRSLKAAAKDLADGFGSLLLPAVTKIVQAVRNALNWLNNLDDGTKRMILTIAGIAAAVGPALLVIGKLIPIMQSLKIAFIAVNAAMAANPILAIVTAAALLGTAAYLLVKNWEKVAPFFARLWNKMIDIFEFAYGPIIAVMLDIINFAKEHLLNGFIKVAEGVGKAIDWIAAKFGKETGAFESITTWIDKWTVPAHERLTFSFDRLKVAVDDTSKTMTEDFGPALEKTGEETKDLADATDGAREAIEKMIAVTGAEIAALALRGTSLKQGWDEEREIYSERAAEIAGEVARKKAAWDEEAATRRAWEETQAEADAKAKADAENREANHQQNVQQIISESFNTVRSLISSLSSYWDSFYEERLSQLDAWYEASKDMLEARFTDETDLADALTNLDEDYAEKKKVILHDQAIADKKFALFEAFITGAQAIINGFATKPFLPLGLAMGLLATLATGVQIAAIASRPIPALAEGGSFVVPPGYPDDSFLFRAQSGEQVDVTPANRRDEEESLFHIQVQIGPDVLYDKISRATRDRQILISRGAVVGP